MDELEVPDGGTSRTNIHIVSVLSLSHSCAPDLGHKLEDSHSRLMHDNSEPDVLKILGLFLG